MGLTERHWFEDEEPELTERQLEDVVREQKDAYERGYHKGCSDRDKILELLKVQQLDIEALKNVIQSMVEGQCIIAGSKQTQIVRCKECKHRPKEIPYKTSYGETQTYIEFPNDSKCPCWNPSDEYYSWNPDDDWFCAEGERRDG